jgi:hypothetical protein
MKFEMTNLGYLHYFFGLQVLQTKEEIFIFHSKYACDLLLHCKSEVIRRRDIIMWTNFYLSHGSLVIVYVFFQKGITFAYEVCF